MAGYNGLGVSRKEIVQASVSEKVYELVADDIYDGYAFDMREELLNHMIIVKSTVSNNMLSTFIDKAMGVDGDFIKFKLIDDLHDGDDTPYADFWGKDWVEDINVKDLQINNVDESDGFYWIMESQNEAFFKKVNGEWKVIRDKGVFDLAEFKNPRFGELNVRNLNADNYLSIKVKDTHVANFNWDKFMIDTMVQFRHALYSIYYDYQPEKTDIGLINKPFGDLFLKGNAISAEPTEENHLTTKKYVDENSGGGGIANIEADALPKLGGDLDINGNYIKLSDTCKAGYNSDFGTPLPFLATANIAAYGNANMPLVVIAEEMMISIGTPNPASQFFGSHFIRHMDIGRRKREREYFFPNPGITFAQDQWYALRVNNGVLEAVTVADNRDTNIWANKLTDMFELTKPWELENIKFSPISFSDADANFNCTMISNTDGTDQYWDYYTQIAVQDHMNHSGVNGMEGILDSETQHARIFVLVQFDRVCTFTGGRLTLTLTEDITL